MSSELEKRFAKLSPRDGDGSVSPRSQSPRRDDLSPRADGEESPRSQSPRREGRSFSFLTMCR
jgi:hypothetical protein